MSMAAQIFINLTTSRLW